MNVSVQVVDDILDFTQTAEQLGKPQGQDLASGNLTAPVIYALQQSKELEEIIQSELVIPSCGTGLGRGCGLGLGCARGCRRHAGAAAARLCGALIPMVACPATAVTRRHCVNLKQY